jgi:hypothetical protein
MLKYASKFFLEILPSVVATVVGAYIVNHYIAPHGYYGYGEPPRAAAVDSAQPAKGTTADLTPAPVATPAADPKPAKGADKGTAPAKAPTAAAKDSIKEIIKETARPEPEPRRFVTRDKAADKAPPPAPAETASIPPAVVTAPAVPEDHPDAAELARAALDRLRTADPAARPAEAPPPAVAVHEAPHDPVRETAHANVVTAVPPPAEARPAAPPLPPPVSVAAPADRPNVANGSAPDAPHAFPHTADADRLVPPAEIPGAMPVDLQPAPKKKSVAEDMLSAARSVFQSVVSQQN